jgi:hypothetical protein
MQVVCETARQWAQFSISSVNVDPDEYIGGLSSTLLVFWPVEPQWSQETERIEELTIFSIRIFVFFFQINFLNLVVNEQVVQSSFLNC